MQQDFFRLDLPPQHFDGVVANASLLLVPGQELARVLSELFATLKPGGVLFSSNPCGNNDKGWNHGRYGVYRDIERWRAYDEGASFVELTHSYRQPGLSRRSAALACKCLAPSQFSNCCTMHCHTKHGRKVRA